MRYDKSVEQREPDRNEKIETAAVDYVVMDFVEFSSEELSRDME